MVKNEKCCERLQRKQKINPPGSGEGEKKRRISKIDETNFVNIELKPTFDRTYDSCCGNNNASRIQIWRQ